MRRREKYAASKKKQRGWKKGGWQQKQVKDAIYAR